MGLFWWLNKQMHVNLKEKVMPKFEKKKKKNKIKPKVGSGVTNGSM